MAAIELDPDVEHGALHRVATHAAIAMPGQVGQAPRGSGDLDDDAVAIEAIVGIAEVVAAQCRDADEAGVGAQSGDPVRPVVEVVDPVAHLAPVDRRPPRLPVVGPRPAEGLGDVGGERCDLGIVEDATEMHESDPVQEVPDLLDGIVEDETLREIHVASGGVRDAGRMVEVEQGLVAEGGPKGRLPARHLAEAAPTDRQLIGVEEREAGLELPREGAPGVGGELDDGRRRAGAGLDGERRAVGHVGVAPSVGELDPERTDDRGVGLGEDGAALLEERGQLLFVEPVEIDRPESFPVHGRNVAATVAGSPGRRDRHGAVATAP